MALSAADGTDQKILDFFSIPGGAVTGYVRITRVELDYDAGTYTALVQAYVSSEARTSRPDAGARRYIGGTLQETEVAAMERSEVRSIIYPSIERLVTEQQTERTAEREA